ncbi:MAG TPA: hypothetical protein VML55_11035, partial [Planctomycetaceae bacterium]|nr:hypothetical protein [Planctomycetaceae bacterium]
PPLEAPLVTDVLRPQTRSESTRRLPMIPVTVAREAAIRAIPSAILVSRQDAASGSFLRRIALVSPAGGDWDVAAVESSEPWLTAKSIAGPEGGRFVELSIPQSPPQADGAAAASVHVETTHPDCPRLAVSVIVE